MIQLASSAIANFDWLAQPPTHASCTSRNLCSLSVISLHVNYAFGTLNEAGEFVPNPRCGTFAFETFEGSKLPDGTDAAPVLSVLYGVGTAPTPGSPAQAMNVPSKRVGDCKLFDVDVVMAAVVPQLAGTAI
jgi:hypothetical protein